MKALLQIFGYIFLQAYLLIAVANSAHGQDTWRPRKTFVDHLYTQGVLDSRHLGIARPSGVVRAESVTQTYSARPVKFLGIFGVVERETIVVNRSNQRYTPSYYTYTSRPGTSVTLRVGPKGCRRR